MLLELCVLLVQEFSQFEWTDDKLNEEDQKELKTSNEFSLQVHTGTLIIDLNLK